MSISIYYSVRRKDSLNPEELCQFERIKRQYSVDREIERYLNTGDGPNWESFCFYNDFPDYAPDDPDLLLEGATKLPDNSEEAIWKGVQHWCRALSALKRFVHGAEWEVRVDDHVIPWDSTSQEFDPTK